MSLTPEERERIAEEQRIRQQEDLKTAKRWGGKVALIMVGIVVFFFLCICFAVFWSSWWSSFTF